MIIRALTCLILSTLSLQSHANEPTPAIAMHGTSPMNAGDFTHLPYTNPNATKGTTLTQCSIGTFDTLNDNTMKGKAAEGLHMLNDPLMRRVWSEAFGLYGVVAKGVILPDDRASITFNLNPNAIFHDGSRITTADVKFSFEQLRDKGKPNTRNVYKLVKNVDIKNDTTIRFDFGEGYTHETALILAMMPIYSKSYWDTREFDKTTLDIPLGSGPYKIKSPIIGQKTIPFILDITISII
jgi:ABC-type oligopeptide transport system substrate-binding subunit